MRDCKKINRLIVYIKFTYLKRFFQIIIFNISLVDPTEAKRLSFKMRLIKLYKTIIKKLAKFPNKKLLEVKRDKCPKSKQNLHKPI